MRLEAPTRIGNLLKGYVRSCKKYVIRWVRLYRRQPIHNRTSVYFSSHPVVLLLTFMGLASLLIYGGYFIYADFTSSTPPKFKVEDDVRDDILQNPSALRNQARILSESLLANKAVCSRESFGSNVEFLRLCGQSVKPSASAQKIVALVEVRNVQATLESFISALSSIVDSVIILDDHSVDLTRNSILSSVQKTANPFHVPVEALLNKSGHWIREELLDRQLLLLAGRHVGGTHFVLLDYDEYFSRNCIANGLLRRSILSLNPGQSLFLPWVELWRSPFVHAVQKTNLHMNFLRRRQVVIFADDGRTQYTKRNSVAKTFSSSASSRPGSIHVLRCPRTLCPPPTNRDSGSESSTRGWGNVTVLSECRIIEMRFLNLDNVLLKSVWYESLGRILDTEDGLTTGKMVDVVLKKLDHSSLSSEDSFSVVPTKPEWISGIEGAVNVHSDLEAWRAQDVNDWTSKRGDSAFLGLKAFSLIDAEDLRNAVEFSSEITGGRILDKVPLKKIGSLIIVIDTKDMLLLSEFIRKLDWNPVDLSEARSNLKLHSGDFDNEILKQEWDASIVRVTMRSIRHQGKGRAFISCSASDILFTLAVLRIAYTELSSLRTLVLFGDRRNNANDNEKGRSEPFQHAVSYALKSGSHITLLDVPFANLGSFIFLRWLRMRLGGRHSLDSRNTREDLTFAEGAHRLYKTKKFAPVSRIFFSLNVGRSGSKYMATVLGTATGPVAALHEPACPRRVCTKGGGMRMQDQLLASTYSMRAKVKQTMIRKAIMELGNSRGNIDTWSQTRRCDCAEVTSQSSWEYGESWETREIYEIDKFGRCSIQAVMDGVYIETNPNFKSWFYDVTLDEFPSSGYEVSVLVVRKYIAAVLQSLFETGFFSERDGYSWMETATSVNAKISKVPLLQDEENLDAIDKLLSYIANSEAVFQHVIKEYSSKSVKFLEFQSEKVYGVEGTQHLFERLGLQPSEQTNKIAADVHDKYGEGGRKRMGSITLNECLSRFESLVVRAGGEHGVVKTLLKNWTKVDGFDYRL